MFSILTLFGCSLLGFSLADIEVENEPFTVFHHSVGLAEDSTELLAESSNTDYTRVERQTGYTNLGYAYQPQASYYQPLAQTYQPAAPAYQPAAPAYSPYTSYDVEAPAADVTPVETVETVEAVLPAETVTVAPTPIPTTPAPTFKDIIGFNLAEKTRRDSDAIQAYMRSIASNDKAVSFLNELVETNPCVNSIEGTIQLLERGTRVVEKSAPGMEKLFVTLQSLRGERNITTLVKGSSDILKQLDSLFPQLESFNFFLRCRASPDQGVASLRDLAQIIYRLSLVDDPKFTTPIKENLFESAILTEAITNFLQRFQEKLNKRDCFTQKDFLADGIQLTADVIDGMAEVLGVIGKLPLAKEARAYAAFTRSTAISLKKLEEFKFEDDCSPGALLRGAEHLDDIANLISEIGLESLSIQLGIVFRLDLLP